MNTHSLTTEAIAGIAVAAAVIGMLLAVAIRIFIWRRQKTKHIKQEKTSAITLDALIGVAEVQGDQQHYDNSLVKKEDHGSQVVEIGDGDFWRQASAMELPTHTYR
jgi:hypothetical protein